MVGAPPHGEGEKPVAASDTPASDATVAPRHPHPAAAGEGGHVKAGKWGLIIGAIGVVFGDIGTSPLYAMREALHHSRSGGTADLAILGVVSLVFWALILVVTLKYVVFLMKADNKGEGGTLALMALAQHAVGRRSGLIFILGVCGAALFYGDGVITPAVSVLSAIEGLRDAPGVSGQLDGFVLPIAAGILIALFMIQSRGTASMARYFGPLTLVWFLILAGLGVWHIFDDPSIFRALSPHLGPDTLLASNTSSISITRLASATDRPERFIGLHFMNPVPRMNLVEIIRGIATGAETYETAVNFARSLGKTTANAEDFPAFIVNRVLVPMINEAIYTLYEGVGTVEAIDTAMKLGANHPMGPLELGDFIGLDTVLSIMNVLYDGLADSKYRPCPLLVKYVEAGWLGRKAGRGFYDYRGENPVPTR